MKKVLVPSLQQQASNRKLRCLLSREDFLARTALTEVTWLEGELYPPPPLSTTPTPPPFFSSPLPVCGTRLLAADGRGHHSS